jgi:hypothetical protein
MRMKIITVSRTDFECKSPNPRITFFGSWLNKIGFCQGKLIKVDYSDASITLRILDEESHDYIQFVKDALVNNQDGLLIVKHKQKQCKIAPSLALSGSKLAKSGFKIGSKIVAQFEYGLIYLRLVQL